MLKYMVEYVIEDTFMIIISSKYTHNYCYKINYYTNNIEYQ